MPPNGISSLDDFREAARLEREKRAEPVRLPSGLVARLVRPTPLELLYITGRLPQSVAARISPAPGQPPLTARDVIELGRQLNELVEFVFVSPRVPEEAKPSVDIAVSDIEYALRWARGEVLDTPPSYAKATEGLPSEARSAKEGPGLDLAEFRGERGGTEATPPAGSTGGDVRPTAE